MAKEVKKKSSSKKVAKKKSSHVSVPRVDRNLEKILIENFISMQKVMTSFVSKFDKLEKQVSSLLDLFEESAKTIAEKEINLELKGNEEKQQEILDKLKDVLDQNKLIAKGITLMHEASFGDTSSRGSSNSNEQRNNNVPSPSMPSKVMRNEESFSTPETMPSFKKPKVKEESKESSPDSSVNFSI